MGRSKTFTHRGSEQVILECNAVPSYHHPSARERYEGHTGHRGPRDSDLLDHLQRGSRRRHRMPHNNNEYRRPYFEASVVENNSAVFGSPGHHDRTENKFTNNPWNAKPPESSLDDHGNANLNYTNQSGYDGSYIVDVEGE